VCAKSFRAPRATAIKTEAPPALAGDKSGAFLPPVCQWHIIFQLQILIPTQ
jgi:hypothetical protein